VRVFPDADVLASSIATRGFCNELLESIINEHQLLTCEPVLRELERVLADKFRLPKPVIEGFPGLLKTEGRIISAHETPAVAFKDQDDIPILACVIAGRADVFVTGDKALLDLGLVASIPILSPRQIWQKLAGIENTGKAK
jgi:putative PIN family toxin of toxin-antitoxin system